MADTEREMFDSASTGEAITAEPAPVATPAPAEAATAADSRARDEQGRFAAAAAASPPAGTPEPSGVPSGEPGQQSEAERAKTRALREERDARQALERKVAELEGRLPKAAPPPPPEKIQLWDDPDKWGEELIESRLAKERERFETELKKITRWREMDSQRAAIKEHGQEAVGAAYAALNEASRQDPVGAGKFAAELQSSEDPAGNLVAWHKRQQVFKEIGTDPEAYRQRIEAEVTARLQGSPAPTGQPRPQKNVIDLPSLNSASGRGNASVGPESERELYASASARR